jgi:hypothetical protein
MAPARKFKIDDKTLNTYSTPVKVPACFTLGDVYCLLLVLFTLVLGLPVALLQLAALLPPLVLIRTYSCCLTAPVDLVGRGPFFHCASLLIALASAPVIILSFLWVWALRIFRLLSGVPFALLCCNNALASRRELAMFQGAPGVIDEHGKGRTPIDAGARTYGWLWSFHDLVVCVLGALDREGFCDTWRGLSTMLIVCPLYKILIATNYFVYRLKPLFINQWTKPLDTNSDGKIDWADQQSSRLYLRNVLCRPKLIEHNRALADTWHFLGHYPYPPKGRASRTHAGIQFYDGAVMTALLTHTAHCTEFDDNHTANAVEGHAAQSETANVPIVAVYLQAWNPFHFWTGYVEVNGRTDGGVEHPMWLVCAAETSKLHAEGCHGLNKLFVRLGIRFGEYVQAQATLKGQADALSA